MTKNNATEFKFIIKEITKHDLITLKIGMVAILTKMMVEMEEMYGICSKHITNLYYIKDFNPNSNVNNLEFKVGSECVKKIDSSFI